MLNARDDVKMSRDHKDVAATIAELGVPNVVCRCRLTLSHPCRKRLDLSA